MIEASYTFDLFEPETGRLTVEYSVFGKSTESLLIPAPMVRKHVETRVRNLICDRIEKTRNQRSENYRYGDSWGVVASKALFAIPAKLQAARNIKDMKTFAEYIEVDIRPLLDDITPHFDSRFYHGYMEQLELLDIYLQKIHLDPAYFDILKAEKKPAKAI